MVAWQRRPVTAIGNGSHNAPGSSALEIAADGAETVLVFRPKQREGEVSL
jgi:hypothetical protein